MELSVVDPEEKALNERVDKLIGTDTNLATIVKMSLNPDCVDEATKDKILYSIKLANEKEAKAYAEQFKFTMDMAGNIIELNSIDERIEQIEADSGSIVSQSSGGE